MDYAMKQLIGKKIQGMGRACNMLCVPIGETVAKSKTGAELTQYEIHVQCAWRLLDAQKEIMVASSDVFLPPSNQKWSDSFQWDIKGGNLFDERITHFNELHKELRIKDVTIIEKCNDLILLFSDGCVLETFVDSSLEENWRIIQRKPESLHVVLTGNQLRVDGP